MGANTSKVNVESTSNDQGQEQSFYAERPVRFSPSLIQHLSDLPVPGGDNAPSASRQMTLDEHVRQRINAELARLKAQEEEIQDKIARALEKEKLDREAAAANDGSSKQEDRIKSSTALQQELAELKKKIDINREKRDLERNFPEIAKARSQLLACYRDKRDRPLDCWAEAADFRTAVKQAEQQFVQAEAAKVQ